MYKYGPVWISKYSYLTPRLTTSPDPSSKAKRAPDGRNMRASACIQHREISTCIHVSKPKIWVRTVPKPYRKDKSICTLCSSKVLGHCRDALICSAALQGARDCLAGLQNESPCFEKPCAHTDAVYFPLRFTADDALFGNAAGSPEGHGCAC